VPSGDDPLPHVPDPSPGAGGGPADVPVVVDTGTPELPTLSTVLVVPLPSGGALRVLGRVVLPRDGRPPVVVLTELPGQPVPWTDGRVVAALADALAALVGDALQVRPEQVFWFADHAPQADGEPGLLRRLEVLVDGRAHTADPRHSEVLAADAAAWWRAALGLRPPAEVLPLLEGGTSSRP